MQTSFVACAPPHTPARPMHCTPTPHPKHPTTRFLLQVQLELAAIRGERGPTAALPRLPRGTAPRLVLRMQGHAHMRPMQVEPSALIQVQHGGSLASRPGDDCMPEATPAAAGRAAHRRGPVQLPTQAHSDMSTPLQPSHTIGQGTSSTAGDSSLHPPAESARALFGDGHASGITVAAQAAVNALHCAVHLSKLQFAAQQRLTLSAVPQDECARQELVMPLLQVQGTGDETDQEGCTIHLPN